MKFILRELSRQDLPCINLWRNNITLVKSLGSPFRYISPEIDEKWYGTYLENRSTQIRLAIVPESCSNLVGLVSLTSIDWVYRSAEFSICLGDPDFCGQGLGMHVSTRVIEHGFNDYGLNRIWLSVNTDNSRALRLYSKLGFVQEGTLRQSIFKNGKFCDAILMSLLVSDWSTIPIPDIGS